MEATAPNAALIETVIKNMGSAAVVVLVLAFFAFKLANRWIDARAAKDAENNNDEELLELLVENDSVDQAQKTELEDLKAKIEELEKRLDGES
jgi:flagellar biosynthesis/type III secretory pathway M-ring protein FliF/YscJ